MYERRVKCKVIQLSDSFKARARIRFPTVVGYRHRIAGYRDTDRIIKGVKPKQWSWLTHAIQIIRVSSLNDMLFAKGETIIWCFLQLSKLPYQCYLQRRAEKRKIKMVFGIERYRQSSP